MRVAMDTQTLQPTRPHHGRDDAPHGQLIAVDAQLRQVATPLRHRQQGRVVQVRWSAVQRHRTQSGTVGPDRVQSVAVWPQFITAPTTNILALRDNVNKLRGNYMYCICPGKYLF